MRTRIAAVAAGLLAVGCGGGGKGDVKPIDGPAREVAAVVQRFETAMRRGDFETICGELVTASVRQRSGGASCPRILGQRAGGVRRPRIRIDSIAVSGRTARASVRTTAVGQLPARVTIRLVREGGRFRIASLG